MRDIINELAEHIESFGFGRPSICGTFLCGEKDCGHTLIEIYRNNAPAISASSRILVRSASGGASVLAGDKYDYPSFVLVIQDSDLEYAKEIARTLEKGLQCNRRIGHIVSILTSPPNYSRIPKQGLHRFSFTLNLTVERVVQ